MTYHYTNRKKVTYYLYQKPTKKGKVRYFFSQKQSAGNPVNRLPEGYEVYENPNAVVFLRKKQTPVITRDEITLIEQGVREHCQLPRYIIDVKKNVIRVFIPDQDVDGLIKLFSKNFLLPKSEIMNSLENVLTYSPVMQFVLVDKDERLFQAERYCYRGSIDDWIPIGLPNSLSKLAEKYLRHINKDSYFELM
ncbi:MAG: hypothetical protein J7L22_00645 [Candidatus Marinimicrobia bacterium]|nr:hypothetical protein [Candidatus Neomarinimicrobiota bacterium]